MATTIRPAGNFENFWEDFVDENFNTRITVYSRNLMEEDLDLQKIVADPAFRMAREQFMYGHYFNQKDDVYDVILSGNMRPTTIPLDNVNVLRSTVHHINKDNLYRGYTIAQIDDGNLAAYNGIRDFTMLHTLTLRSKQERTYFVSSDKDLKGVFWLLERIDEEKAFGEFAENPAGQLFIIYKEDKVA